MEIHSLGTGNWLEERRPAVVKEIESLLYGVIKKRVNDELTSLKFKKNMKANCPKSEASEPTMLNGPSLRIAYSFEPLKFPQRHLLFTNLTRGFPAEACCAYEFLQVKMVVYALPLHEFQKVLKRQKHQGGSVNVLKNKNNPSVSEYFKGNASSTFLAQNKERLQNVMKKTTHICSKGRKRKGALKEFSVPKKNCVRPQLQENAAYDANNDIVEPVVKAGNDGDTPRDKYKNTCTRANKNLFLASWDTSPRDSNPTCLVNSDLSNSTSELHEPANRKIKTAARPTISKFQFRNTVAKLPKISEAITISNAKLTPRNSTIDGLLERKPIDAKESSDSENEFASTEALLKIKPSPRDKVTTVLKQSHFKKGIEVINNEQGIDSFKKSATRKETQSKRRYGLELSDDEDFAPLVKRSKRSSRQVVMKKSTQETKPKRLKKLCDEVDLKENAVIDKTKSKISRTKCNSSKDSTNATAELTENGTINILSNVDKSGHKSQIRENAFENTKIASNDNTSLQNIATTQSNNSHIIPERKYRPCFQVLKDRFNIDLSELNEEPEDIMEDCFILDELSWTPNEANSNLDRAISRTRQVSDLSEEQLVYIVRKNELYLREIFQGKVANRRHDDYKRGGKARINLMYQINIALFRESQHDTIMETLIDIFCKKHNKYFDYLARVMLPEILNKIYRDIHHVTHEEAEQAMHEALMTPGAMFMK